MKTSKKKSPKKPLKNGTKKTHRPIDGAYTMSYRGTETFGRVFVEAIRGLDAQTEAIGFPSLKYEELRQRMSGLPQTPEEPFTGPTASVFAIPGLVKLMIILKEPITKALVEVASGQFFKLLLPKIGRLFTSKPKPGEAIQYPVLFHPAMFFQAENVVITAMMTISKPEDYKCAEDLVPRVFERGVEWLERNGRQVGADLGHPKDLGFCRDDVTQQ